MAVTGHDDVGHEQAGHGHQGHGDQGHGHQGHGHQGEGHEHPGGLRGLLVSVLRPHSHDAADSVDEALESTARGVRALKVSLVGLGLTAALQAVVVAFSGSVALLADTIHNLADAGTSLPLWVAFALSRRAADRRYTYGYGRAEDLAGVTIVVVIAASAVLAGWESFRKLADPAPLAYAWWVLAAGVIGFAGNEAVAVYRIRVGRQIGSAALVADGLHARADGFASLAVVLGAAGSMAGFPLADPLVGLAITVAILVVLRGAAVQVYRRLMDAVDPELTETAEASVRAVPGVVDVEPMRLRWIGHRIRAEVAVTVDRELDIVAAHRIADDVEHTLLHEVPRLHTATVHVGPAAAEGVDDHLATGHHPR